MLHDVTGNYKRLSATERTTVVFETKGHAAISFQATICHKQHTVLHVAHVWILS